MWALDLLGSVLGWVLDFCQRQEEKERILFNNIVIITCWKKIFAPWNFYYVYKDTTLKQENTRNTNCSP